MQTKEFIPNDPEQILSDTIATYQQKSGEKLNSADPERIIIDCMSYREMILRGRIEHLMRQNFVQYATGESLDNWGVLFGIGRLSGESDDDYRERILNSTHSAIGTEAAYRQRILALDEVSDILIDRKCDDPMLPPGVVQLTPLMRTLNSGVTTGATHTPEVETAILTSIQAEDFGVIGSVFIFASARPVCINGSVSVRSMLGFTQEQLTKNISRKVAGYFGALSLHYAGEFGTYDLERVVATADGVLSVASVEFPNVPTKQARDFYVQGEIMLNFL